MSATIRVSRGRHASRGHGLCVMELAAAVAGEPHSDRPVCVHPLLAAVARTVNDSVSDDARQQLVTLLDRLIGTASDDPQVARRIVAVACSRALAAGALPVWALLLRRELALAERALDGASHAPTAARPRRQLRAVRAAAASLALAPVRNFDGVLLGLLADCAAAARTVDGREWQAERQGELSATAGPEQPYPRGFGPDGAVAITPSG